MPHLGPLPLTPGVSGVFGQAYAVEGQFPIVLADIENSVYGLGSPLASVASSDIFVSGTSGIMTSGANAHAPNIQTVLLRATMPNPLVNTAEAIWSVDGGTLGTSFTLRTFNAGNTIQLLCTNSTQQANINGGVAADGSTFIAAGRFALNDFGISLNGAGTVTDTSGTEPTVTTLRSGTAPSQTAFSGTVLQIGFFTDLFTNAQLEAASTSWGA